MAAATLSPSLICAPLVAPSVDQMLHQAQQAKAGGADLVEFRLDYLKSFHPQKDLPVLMKDKTLPSIVTYRPKWEGGHYDGDEQKRLEALCIALECGSEYVDVEHKAADNFIGGVSKKKNGTKIIVSSHNFQDTPATDVIGNQVSQMQSAGADIVKIVTMGKDITDVARVFKVMEDSMVPIIGLVMGDRGQMSRVLAPKYGGYLTYGSIESGKESAPGQPTIKDLLNIYHYKRIGKGTQIFGIIGKPVYHSKGPVLYNKAFNSIGLDAVYVHYLVDDLPKFIDVYSGLDYQGFSCTIPHKEIMCDCCDEVDPVAKSIGAVNAIIRRDGKLLGYNTDYIGAISAIEDALRASNLPGLSPTGSPLAGKIFFVIGAGGAGKSLAYGAKEKGARVFVANRSHERAKQLADAVGGTVVPFEEREHFHPEEGMILANTTPVGMTPNTDLSPMPKHALKHYSLVFDAIYTPIDTRLLTEAKEMGAIPVSGVEMFVRQAKGQFELYTGLPAPESVMREAVLQKK